MRRIDLIRFGVAACTIGLGSSVVDVKLLLCVTLPLSFEDCDETGSGGERSCIGVGDLCVRTTEFDARDASVGSEVRGMAFRSGCWTEGRVRCGTGSTALDEDAAGDEK